MRKKRRTSPTRKATVSKKSSPKTAKASLTPSQKRLKERQTPPWKRLEQLGYQDPYIYDIPWKERALAQFIHAQSIPGLGYVTEGLSKYGEEYHVQPYSWASYVEKKIKKSPTPYPNGRREEDFMLREDQKEDLATILSARANGAPEFLIANHTGTGKTVTAWSAVQNMHPQSVLIVCPAAVIPVWRQHIKDMGDRGMDIVTINYESLRSIICPPEQAVSAKKTETQNKNMALHGKPYTTFDVVIFDESHKMKNPTSQQSRICNTLANSAKFIIKITATPGKDPSQLHYMWRGLSWVTGDEIEVTDEKHFDNYVAWCQKNDIAGIKQAPFGNGLSWDGDKQDLLNMESLLYGDRQGIYWSTRRKSALEVVQQPLLVTIDPKEKEAYDNIVEDVKSQILDSVSRNRKDLSKGIAAMMSLRQKTGLLKSESVADYAKYCVKDLDEQVVISSYFHNSSEAVSQFLDKAGIGHVIIDGTISTEEKERRRLKFQKGEVPVIISSVAEGISLHANQKLEDGVATSNDRRLLVLDTPWSPVAMQQIAGRINREESSGIISFPYLEDTIDEKVLMRLLSGLASQSIIQGDNQEDQLRWLAEEMGLHIKF